MSRRSLVLVSSSVDGGIETKRLIKLSEPLFVIEHPANSARGDDEKMIFITGSVKRHDQTSHTFSVLCSLAATINKHTGRRSSEGGFHNGGERMLCL